MEQRLKIFKRLKETEDDILNVFGKNPNYFKLESKNIAVVFAPAKNITVNSIHESIQNIIKTIPKKEKVPEAIVKRVISLEETIASLTERVTEGVNLSFKEFSKYDKEERVNVVVSFLAMLELVKEGVIDVRQDNNYEDIEMQTKVFGTPNYS